MHAGILEASYQTRIVDIGKVWMPASVARVGLVMAAISGVAWDVEDVGLLGI